MKKIEVPDIASNATAYQLDDGRIYRVHMVLVTPAQLLATADYVEVETRGYQIAANGAFMVDDNGEPIMLTPQRARIPLVNVRSGLDTVKPGWVKQAPIPEGRELDTTGARKLKTLPKTGEPGEKVLIGDELHAYTDGLYDHVRRSRLANLATETPVAPLDAATLADLTP